MSNLVEFIKEHGNKIQRPQAEEIAKTFEKHEEYNTSYILRTEKIIIGIARWNFSTLKEAKVLDVIIHKKFRSLAMIRTMIDIGFEMYPNAEKITYERAMKNKSFKTLEYSKIRR